MKRFTLFLLMIASLLSGRASGTWNLFLTVETDTAEYVAPKDTTVYIPPVDTTHYEPVDTGEVVRPDVPSKPVIYVPTIHEGDNVTEFPHNPAVDDMLSSVKPAKQEFTMTIEGEYLRIKGTLMARGYDKHYIHCQIIGDSVHLQRFDMDPESTDMILHNVDIRIPGFTEDYYKVTLAEQNDVPIYKQYMMMAKAVTRSTTYKPTEFSVTGTKWYANRHYENLLFGNNKYSNTPVCYSLGEDTICNGETYKSFYVNGKSYGAIREHNGQVWYYPNENYPYALKKDTPYLLYDFTLQVGDIIYSNEFFAGYTKDIKPDYIIPDYIDPDFSDDYELYFYPCVVKDTYEINGRKVIEFEYGEQWIEGIGSSKSAFFSPWDQYPTDGSSGWERVYQVVSDGKTIYFNGDVADPDATPWLKEGMTWTQNWNYSETSDGEYRQFTLDKEIRPGTFTFNSTYIDPWFPFKHIQEFNGKVYTIDDDQYIDLCYDFTLQKGESASILSAYWLRDPLTPAPPVREYNKGVVSVVDSVEYGGIMRKRIVLTGEHNDVWVEGIGSLTRMLPIDDYNMPTGIVFNSSRITCLCQDEEILYLHPDFIDCTTRRTDKVTSLNKECSNIQTIGASLLCTAPDAVKLEVYTMDATKVGEARFVDGEATVKVGEAPAMYLYIVTYPDGRRESGKARVSEE